MTMFVVLDIFLSLRVKGGARPALSVTRVLFENCLCVVRDGFPEEEAMTARE